MATYSEQVRQTFLEMETEDLVDRVKGGTLTLEAHQVALEILTARNVPISELPRQPTPSPHTEESPSTKTNTRIVLLVTAIVFVAMWGIYECGTDQYCAAKAKNIIKWLVIAFVKILL